MSLSITLLTLAQLESVSILLTAFRHFSCFAFADILFSLWPEIRWQVVFHSWMYYGPNRVKSGPSHGITLKLARSTLGPSCEDQTQQTSTWKLQQTKELPNCDAKMSGQIPCSWSSPITAHSPQKLPLSFLLLCLSLLVFRDSLRDCQVWELARGLQHFSGVQCSNQRHTGAWWKGFRPRGEIIGALWCTGALKCNLGAFLDSLPPLQTRLATCDHGC